MSMFTSYFYPMTIVYRVVGSWRTKPKRPSTHDLLFRVTGATSELHLRLEPAKGARGNYNIFGLDQQRDFGIRVVFDHKGSRVTCLTNGDDDLLFWFVGVKADGRGYLSPPRYDIIFLI